jgi:formate hydrogenlyase subunit 3/multisubunit Na+/H+ antiporter MnhD subunit
MGAVMNNDDKSKGISPIRTWAIYIGFAVVLVGICYDKAHPHFLGQLIGKSGIDVLGMGFCGYLVFKGFTGARNGTIAGIYGYSWKRSEDAPMFWFCVVLNVELGGMLGVGLAGNLLGFW